MPEDGIPVNVDTRHNIDSAINRARKSGEPFDREGQVDEPSDRRGTFVLALPNDRDRALIRNA